MSDTPPKSSAPFESGQQGTEQQPSPTKTSGMNPWLLGEWGLQVAVDVAVPLLLFVWLGGKVDRRWDTKLGTVVGILVALAVSCLLIYRNLSQLLKKSRQRPVPPAEKL